MLFKNKKTNEKKIHQFLLFLLYKMSYSSVDQFKMTHFCGLLRVWIFFSGKFLSQNILAEMLKKCLV